MDQLWDQAKALYNLGCWDGGWSIATHKPYIYDQVIKAEATLYENGAIALVKLASYPVG